ncbi:MAG: 5'/3'-nucleotidase SurE [Mogibacterium sp.]|nr:5'/3'-nucleotidase SurE [Mogibacterium sp.]
MKKVLVTNDDGIDALGIKTLVEALAPLADVYVVAPQEQQSAKAHSITFLRPIKPEKREMKGAVCAYAVDGTPVDCVKWGLVMLKEEGIKPDFIFSGINHGMNTGLAAYYSGTLAAAREGALSGIHSIALSEGDHAVFDATEFEYITSLIPMLMDMTSLVENDVIISVNAPELPPDKVKGYKVVEAAPFGYGETYDFVKQVDGTFQMMSHPARLGDSIKYDFDAVEAGYAAISPIPTSMTDHISLSRLQSAYATDKVLTVIVDAQADMLDEIEEKFAFESKLNALACCIERMDMPILLTEQYGKGDIIEGVREHSPRSEIVERVQMNPWFAKDMERHTGLIDSRRVLVSGAETHTAVLETALGFKNRGYEVCILEDCCAASELKEHRRAIGELKEAGCEISCLEVEIGRLADSSDLYIRDAVERIIRRSKSL